MNAVPNTEAVAGIESIIALVRDRCQPLAAERAPLASALHRVLRETVRASEDQPAFDRSAMDGFAVRLDDASARYRVVDEIRAGDWKPRALQAGEAVRISTGGALPGEGLQVLKKEDVQVEGDCLLVRRREATRHVRFRGEEAHRGQALVESGTMLGPGTLALLASLGHTEPLVTRRPRVWHVATGNEVVPPDQTPRPGQIRDSNSTLVRAFLQLFGIEPRHFRAPEELLPTEEALRRQLSAGDSPDVLLVSGGASVGEHDFTRQLFERLGWNVHVARTNTRPGKPLIVATHDNGIAFGLPGNPLAHFVCLNLFVRTALEGLASLPDRELLNPAMLAVELTSDGSARETLWPAVVSHTNGRTEVTPLRWSSSGDLTSLARANALLRVPAGATRLAAGSSVTFCSTTPPR